MNNFIEYHRDKPISVELPTEEKMDVFIMDKMVMDDYSKEYYLNILIKDRNKHNKLTDKMVEHYVYNHIKNYLKLFSIEGDIYVKFNYL